MVCLLCLGVCFAIYYARLDWCVDNLLNGVILWFCDLMLFV